MIGTHEDSCATTGDHRNLQGSIGAYRAPLHCLGVQPPSLTPIRVPGPAPGPRSHPPHGGVPSGTGSGHRAASTAPCSTNPIARLPRAICCICVLNGCTTFYSNFLICHAIKSFDQTWEKCKYQLLTSPSWSCLIGVFYFAFFFGGEGMDSFAIQLSSIFLIRMLTFLGRIYF